MPIRNTIKQYDAPAYYHVYSRGASGGAIFKDTADNQKFLSLLARYVGYGQSSNRHGYCYPTYGIEILAYCLMGNHFHLFIYQPDDVMAMSKFMQSVLTAYTMYFNRKYKRQGRLFQSTFKAAHITNDAYFAHITRYIHMNPRDYDRYRWSSLPAYVGGSCAPWLRPERARTMSPTQYQHFLDTYAPRKDELRRLKHLLAS